MIQAYPGIVASVRANRAFLARVVRFLSVEAGTRQFLDIGTGIPAANNTHEIAQSVAPGCRAVYVDYDPVVLLPAQALLTSSAQGALDYIDADLRDPQKLLAHAARTLDFSWRCPRRLPTSRLNRWPRRPGGTTVSRGRPSAIAATPKSCASSMAWNYSNGPGPGPAMAARIRDRGQRPVGYVGRRRP